MITKLASSYINGTNQIVANVKGFQSATLNVKKSVDERTTIYAYVTRNGSTPSVSSEQIFLYNGCMKHSTFVTLQKTGTYSFEIDLSGITNISLAISGESVSATLSLSQSKFELPISVTTINSGNTFDVSAYNSVRLKVSATANATLYGYSNGSNSVNSVFLKGRIVTLGSVLIDTSVSEIKVDCKDVKTLALTSSGDFTAIIIPSDEVINKDEYRENFLDKDNNTLVLDGGVQLDFTIKASGGGTAKIYLEGSNDDFANYDNIPIYATNRNQYYKTGIAANVGSIVGYAYISGYAKIRFRTEQTVSKAIFSNIQVHQELVEGRRIASGDTYQKELNGYKYFKVLFAPKVMKNGNEVTNSVTDGSGFIVLRIDGDYVQSQCTYYDRGCNKVGFPVIYNKAGLTNYGARGWEILSTPTGGGFIFEYPETVNAGTSIQFGGMITNKRDSNTTTSCLIYLECYTKMPTPETCMKLSYEKNDYNVYELASKEKNKDVFNNDVLEWSDNNLTFWHGGYLGVRYDIPFTADNVAHFVEGETILFAYLLPMRSIDMYRNDATATECNPSRIVVFTKSRVFHNYPSRSSAPYPNSDLMYFDESAIIFHKNYWEPVNDKSEAGGNKKYFPVLAQYDYDQFDGRVGTSGADDPYGNGGLPSDKALVHIPISGIQFWNRLSYSSMAKGDKYCAFGNYNTIPGSEPFVMCTNDGGRTWYVKAYFACTEDYDDMYGSKIDLTPISDVAPYVANSIKLCHRKYNIPTAETKEPSRPYIIDTSEQSLITQIEYDSDSNLVVTLADNIDFGSQRPVVFFKNISANAEWDYICNNNQNEEGTAGNGILFRAIKVDNTTNKFKIFANVGNNFAGNAGGDLDDNQSLICRHVHAVNQVEAGCLVSTGESYAENHFEGGFLYLIEQNAKNGTNTINISAGSIMGKVWRLNSSPQGVNRAAGAYIFSDNDDPTLLYVSDESFVVGDNHKRYFDLPGRTVQYPTTPAGVFVGKLSDVDDQSKYKCVCELHMTMIGLLQTHGHFGADGHNTSICFSKNGFDWTIDVNNGSKINGYDDCGNIYFGNKVVIFK